MSDLSQRIANLPPEIRALLELQLQQKGLEAARGLAIPRRDTNAPAPLSFAQQRLWFLDQLEPNSPLYNIPRALRMQGVLDVVTLQKSLNVIVARHETLRTTVISVDGSPVPSITDPRTVDLPIIDLSALPEAVREAEVQWLIREEAQRPFNLTRDLMLRATLLRLGPAEHILLLTMHHIASDAWSMGILSYELAALYNAFSTGYLSPLPALPIQYADYAVWQRQWLQGEVLEKQLSYWKQQLAGPLPVLQLPTDHPRPAIQTSRGARHVVVLPTSLTNALKALSQREGVTLFMTLLAAFQVLLQRYTGQDDILVGSPMANRTRAELEGLIGFFVNTLVLRTDLSGNPTFQELLGRVREVALEAYAHQDLPFEKLVEELQPERSLSHSPLFQVMFILHNAPRQTLELPGLTLRYLEVNSRTSKFDLTLSIFEGAEGLRGTLEYNTDLFEAATIRRLLGHFQTLLEDLVADPKQRLSDLSLLTPAERRQLLVEWNSTTTDYPKNWCLHQLFEAQVAHTPDATAVIFEDHQLTYRELNTRANQLAHHLKQLGIGPEALVAICIECSLEMVVGLLGTLKAGAAYVPLDPAYPMERLAFMIEDAQAAVLLTQKRLLVCLPEHKAQMICLDTNWETVAQEPTENPTSMVTAANPAYVIYTSGSTGQPKGVMIPHQGLVNYLSWCTKAYAVAGGSGAPVHSPLGFDLTITSLLSPLLAGRSVVLLPEGQGIETLGTVLRAADNFSLVKITPAHLEVLSQGLPADAAAGRTRAFIIGGEALWGESLAFWCTHAPYTRLINEYGPTETVVGCCVYEVPAGASITGAVPIGRPIANVQLYILDVHLQPVPIGVPGELYIGGDGLARGYLNRPELTAEKFIPSPFSSEPGARLYKTGDLARYLSDGTLAFLGRLDHQVKLRGFRIELGEIEAVLSQHPAVRETVVVAREDTPGDRRLAAYVVSDQEPAPTSYELRAFLQAKLPEYMIPSALVRLDDLPLTSNGKVDRQALPAPDQVRHDLQSTFVAPRDPLEFQLTRLWEAVLGIQPIGMRDNFFELGGHSLLAVRLFAHIEKVFGKYMPLAALFQAPTVEQLASILRRDGWSMPWSSLVAIQPGGSKPPFFCIHPQVFMFYDLARHLGPDQPFYGLQEPGPSGPQPRHSRVEDMAADYIKEIRTLQPEGPYFLGGFCFGGKVAFEMAQQLRAQGQKAALLALFDAYAPGHPQKIPYLENLRLRANSHADTLRRLRPQEKLNYVLERMGNKVQAIAMKGKKRFLKTACKVYLRIGRPLPPTLRRVQEATPQPISPYRPRVYPGLATLFRPSQQPAGYYPEPQMGWDGLVARGLEIHDVPGNSLVLEGSMIVEPNVRILAEQLRACLQRARLTD